MKLYLASDLHLEFGDIEIRNNDDVDVLVLSGDIFVAHDIEKCKPGTTEPSDGFHMISKFFDTVSQRFDHMVYVMGNHEHYGSDFAQTPKIISRFLKKKRYSNVHFLNNSAVKINSWHFAGCTLWTDMSKSDPFSMWDARFQFNDFKRIKNKRNAACGWKYTPEDAVNEHVKSKNFLDKQLADWQQQGVKNIVVVGHHAPSQRSIHPRYSNNRMNCCYSSDMDEFVLQYPDIALWTHGHVHQNFDYMVGTTRVVCNPRGYIGYEPQASDWKPQLIELEA